MGFNILDYKEPLSKLDLQETGKWINADGIDPYSYAGGDDEYDYAGGCGVLHPFNSKKREECEKANLTAKTTETESDILLAKATLAKASQPQQAPMSPLAITGIIVGSLLAITVMVVVIKKVKANRG
jgi:hypothetical protein